MLIIMYYLFSLLYELLLHFKRELGNLLDIIYLKFQAKSHFKI